MGFRRGIFTTQREKKSCNLCEGLLWKNSPKLPYLKEKVEIAIFRPNVCPLYFTKNVIVWIYSQICLNPLVNDCQSTYLTKLKKNPWIKKIHYGFKTTFKQFAFYLQHGIPFSISKKIILNLGKHQGICTQHFSISSIIIIIVNIFSAQT